MTTTESKADRSAAITGAGSGLGRELALQLGRRGYAVFGTALSEDEAEELRSAKQRSGPTHDRRYHRRARMTDTVQRSDDLAGAFVTAISRQDHATLDRILARNFQSYANDHDRDAQG